MKNILIILNLLIVLPVFSQVNTEKTALLIVDVQDFYFPGGSLELVEPEKAAENASLLLDYFRDHNMMVIHVKHEVKEGGAIYKSLTPEDDELVITKKEVNCFTEPLLYSTLLDNHIKNIVICGMQTHMCMEAATRAASDLKFKCTVISDACATRDLSFDEQIVKAADVHNSTLATLTSYAEITNTQSFLKGQD